MLPEDSKFFSHVKDDLFQYLWQRFKNKVPKSQVPCQVPIIKLINIFFTFWVTYTQIKTSFLSKRSFMHIVWEKTESFKILLIFLLFFNNQKIEILISSGLNFFTWKRGRGRGLIGNICLQCFVEMIYRMFCIKQSKSIMLIKVFASNT